MKLSGVTYQLNFVSFGNRATKAFATSAESAASAAAKDALKTSWPQ